jgi:hypothetical protein
MCTQNFHMQALPADNVYTNFHIQVLPADNMYTIIFSFVLQVHSSSEVVEDTLQSVLVSTFKTILSACWQSIKFSY